MTPSIGWPASSWTMPPIVVPVSNRSSFTSGNFSGMPLVVPEDVDRHELRHGRGDPTTWTVASEGHSIIAVPSSPVVMVAS